MLPRRRRLLAAVAVLSAIAAGAWLHSTDSDTRSDRLRVIHRLDRPIDTPQDDSRGRASSTYLWTADDIARDWTHVASAQSTTYRSPTLDLAHTTHAVVVEFNARSLAEPIAPLLLWSDTPSLSREDFTRNRRALGPTAHGGALVLRGDALAPDPARPIRYLFLHVPHGVNVRAAVAAIGILRGPELSRAAGRGAVRVTLGGESREVFALESGQTLSFALDIPAGASLECGIYAPGPRDSPLTLARVTQTTTQGTRVVFEERVQPGSWHDVRVDLPKHSGSTITLSTEVGAQADGVRYWSVPMILAPDDRPEHPNVVLYVIDSLRADHLGAYGDSGGFSPFLDGLSKQSLVFTRAYAAASWTKPSVVSLLTSLYPQTHRLGARYYADGLPTRCRRWLISSLRLAM